MQFPSSRITALAHQGHPRTSEGGAEIRITDGYQWNLCAVACAFLNGFCTCELALAVSELL